MMAMQWLRRWWRLWCLAAWALLALPLPAMAQNSPAASAAGPTIRASARMAAPPPLTVGGTATLQVDVLTSTWFTQPPVLPALDVPGAMVSGPTGDATLIRDSIDGVAYSGLRFAYQISPTAAGTLRVPAMSIRAQVGQASAPLVAQTQALDIQATLPPGAEVGHQLAASDLRLTQQVQFSAQPPAVGDHISRVITVQAQGAQAMLIPPPDAVDVPGLKAYRAEPVLTPLTDGRGGFLGGQRVDRIDYVVERAGAYTLPEVALPWWKLSAKQPARAVLPAQRFEAKAGAAFQSPFSVQQDLRDLGRQATLRIPGGWLVATALLLLAALAVWAGGPALRRASARLREQALALWARWRGQWRQSEPYAARAMGKELAQQEPGLNALYHWLRRSRHTVSVADATASLPQALREAGARAMRDCYGATPHTGQGLQTLRQVTPRWRKAFRLRAAQAKADDLPPLNPVHVPRSLDPNAGERR